MLSVVAYFSFPLVFMLLALFFPLQFLDPLEKEAVLALQ